MSQFKNSPALQKIMRALGAGEKLSNSEIRARVGSSFSTEQQKRLTEEELLIVDAVGRTKIFTLTDKGFTLVREDLGGPIEPPIRVANRLPEKERLALFALLSPQLQRSISDIKQELGVTVGPAVRESLKSKGLVRLFNRPIRLELTEKGWQVAETELARPAEPTDPSVLKMLHYHFNQVLGHQRSQQMGLVDLYVKKYPTLAETVSTGNDTAEAEPTKTVGARVIDAHPDLAYEPGGWVSLTRLREHLSDVDRDELDEVLTALFRDDRIKLIAEVNQKTLTDQDRAAALHVVGDDKHLYTVG